MKQVSAHLKSRGATAAVLTLALGAATSFSEDWRCAASACFWQRHRLHCWHFSRFR